MTATPVSKFARSLPKRSTGLIYRREEVEGEDLSEVLASIPDAMSREIVPLIGREFAKLREDMQERDRQSQKEILRLKEEMVALEASKQRERLQLERVKDYAEKERF